MPPASHDPHSNSDAELAAIRIGLASSEVIRDWSSGEVKKASLLDINRLPIPYALFCRSIFGLLADDFCLCGKLCGAKNKGKTCHSCGTVVGASEVRRRRMGHIELAAPVVHPLFFMGKVSRLAVLLGMKARDLKGIVYYERHIITAAKNNSPYKVGRVLTNEEYCKTRSEQKSGLFQTETGAEAVRKLLKSFDPKTRSQALRLKLNLPKSRKTKQRLRSHLKLIESFLCGNVKPEWMVLDVIPVISPVLRPAIDLEDDLPDYPIAARHSDPNPQPNSSTLFVDDLNNLYQRVIWCNDKIKDVITSKAPAVILKEKKKKLQQAVDALFNNSRCKPPVTSRNKGRSLRSLTDRLKGKKGRFRENLLGKRVNFSGRSVIVSGPNLRFHECGLPKEIALELYKPFLVRQLVESETAPTIRVAGRMIQERHPDIWGHLEEVIKGHPVILNRAPTLHRMNVQAFEPVLTDEKAIRLHPLACRAFNADYDGDQMAVHLPLSREAQEETRKLLLSTLNLFSPASGLPIVAPSQDIVMGCYYATMKRPNMPGEGMIFSGLDELLQAIDHKIVNRHARIRIRMPQDRWLKTDPAIRDGNIFETTPGRFLFNDLLPDGMPYYNETLRSGGLMSIIQECEVRKGREKTIDILDRLMKFGFEECTRSGMSFAMCDLVSLQSKASIMSDAEQNVSKIQRDYEEGIVSEEDRRSKVIEIWTQARGDIEHQLKEALETEARSAEHVNPVRVMVSSGARGGMEQIRQLAGMRGLMAKPDGAVVEIPIKSNFREGLSINEFFLSVHGARKGLSDSAVKTADAGYLTRRLVFAVQSVIVTCHDCGTFQGILKKTIRNPGGNIIVSLSKQVFGRISCTDIFEPETETRFVEKDELVSAELARKLDASSIENIRIRSPLTCEAKNGICATCYGLDLSTGRLVEPGTAVGIIAAQSIGEPGTQLTLRTFHTGGTANESKDITSGLPRLEELFEARKPKKAAVMSKIDGTVGMAERPKSKNSLKMLLFVVISDENQQVDHPIKSNQKLIVRNGDVVRAGDLLTEGQPRLDDILQIKGREALIEYMMAEFQKVYRGQGVRVDDKHFEVILSQMLQKVPTADDTSVAEESLCGIKKSALKSRSFLARAAFQETADVLSEAAIRGKIARFTMLSTAAMAGRLVHVGTGFKMLTKLHDREFSAIAEQQGEFMPHYWIDSGQFSKEQETGLLELEQDALPDVCDSDEGDEYYGDDF